VFVLKDSIVRHSELQYRNSTGRASGVDDVPPKNAEIRLQRMYTIVQYGADTVPNSTCTGPGRDGSKRSSSDWVLGGQSFFLRFEHLFD
jgi:hypothetical protein